MASQQGRREFGDCSVPLGYVAGDGRLRTMLGVIFSILRDQLKGGTMAEVPDAYADQFQLHIGPLGCTLNFQVSGANLVAPGIQPPIERVATIRLSLQHLKAMAFILHKQIVGYEAQAQLSTGLPVDVLRALQIRQEDWEAFWRP